MMFRSFSHVSFFIMLGCLVGGASSSAGAQSGSTCPTNILRCHVLTLSSNDPSSSISCSDEYSGASADYDLVIGQFKASSSGSSGSPYGAFVETSDMFAISGLPIGANVSFEAELLLRGSAPVDFNAFGGGAAYLGEGESYSVSFDFRRGVVSKTLSVTIDNSVGTPFLVLVKVDAYSLEFGFGAIVASLQFSGLPQGATVTSCQGFIQDFPVPINNESWGVIKAFYR